MSTINANFTDGSVTITDDAGHTATLELSEGDFALTYDAQGGREVTVSQTRGAVSGARKAARRIGSILHRMWLDGTIFQIDAPPTAAAA